MCKEFCFGLALGMIGGALIVVNSQKARKLIRESQDKITEKLKEQSGKKNTKEKSAESAAE